MPEPWIDQLLKACSHYGQASDCCLDPQDDGSLIARVRIDGIYRDVDHCPHEEVQACIARLKSLAGVPAYIIDEAQDGRIDGSVFGIPGDIRAAFLPTVRGPRAALRLPALGALPTPENLGFAPSVVQAIRQAIRQPQGLVLISGPTGSGKTTTIHSLIKELTSERPDRMTLAIEDPVERRLPGIVQVEVNPHRDFDFPNALRASLRQDPDIIIIGEIRDPITATMAVRAALSGHLVISSLHCARAYEALPRLLDMGVEPTHLLPVLHAVLTQRLIRLRHDQCHGEGCPLCHNGFLGRGVVTDWCMPNRSERLAWAQGRTPDLLCDMMEQAASLLADGQTDDEEIRRSLGVIA